MKSGFKACGIHPLNRRAVLKNIPGDVGKEQAPTNTSFSDELVSLLKEERFGRASERVIPKRRRLIDIQPGASVSEDQVQQLMAKRDNAKQDRDNVKRKPPQPKKRQPLDVNIKLEALEPEELGATQHVSKRIKREIENEAPNKITKKDPAASTAKNSRPQKKRPTTKLRGKASGGESKSSKLRI